jgi:hypothetical protein
MYDHNQVQKTQLKQTLGVGFAYTLNNGVKRSDRKDSQWWIKNKIIKNHIFLNRFIEDFF